MVFFLPLPFCAVGMLQQHLAVQAKQAKGIIQHLGSDTESDTESVSVSDGEKQDLSVPMTKLQVRVIEHFATFVVKPTAEEDCLLPISPAFPCSGGTTPR